MTTDEFIFNCKSAIFLSVKKTYLAEPQDLSLVWLSKDLQNRKATFANTVEKEDDRYWEVTYNGDKDEYYVDTYIKFSNTCVSGEQVDFLMKIYRRKEMKWIKFKTRPITEEEREERPWVDEDEQYGFDCPVPDLGQKVLVTDGQWVGVDEWDDFGGVIGLLDFNRYASGYNDLWWASIPDLPKTEGKR
ncbi:DUF6275 family protein [Ligilactobacillus equi]|uniref:Uncharacterized protein n=1 Tax=Ligilactobacillus equi DPC 6820 TaxID=1392007 RepID=V7HW64_9LACO|nr:DUF6275 family protein [Ligilactobacillus equi]ETA73515.1 hypothetical protein LEQ_1210 [Ligilactobacillus equi DPC 6820]